MITPYLAGHQSAARRFRWLLFMAVWIFMALVVRSPLDASQTAVPNPNISTFPAGTLTLNAGQSVRSDNGQYTLIMQTDGNLVLYQFNFAKFYTNTQGTGSTRAVFQSDGNFVVYTASGQARWNSRTAGNPNSRLIVQDDGNLVIYKSNGAVAWNSRTANVNNQSFVNHLVTGTNAHSKIVHPLYPTEDVVVADYDAKYDFGADNTGVSDATGAIQNALNQCSTDGGGTVWLPAGQYIVSGTILIPPFCYLRGDWCDPDLIQGPSTAANYGTLILAEVNSSSPSGGGISVFTLENNAGLAGVTIFYPLQTLNNVIPYGYSIIVQDGSPMSSIEDVTLINAYAGVIISPNLGGHELARVKNLKGTALQFGMTSNNSSDVDVYENIIFSGKYWSNAVLYPPSPALAAISDYTLVNGVAFTFQDLEQTQMAQLSASSYANGILINPFTRIGLSAFIINANITQCHVALYCTPGSLDHSWGLSFIGGSLQGDTQSISNNSGRAWVMVNQTNVIGPENGVVVDGSPFPRSSTTAPIPSYPLVNPASVPRTPGNAFLNTSLSPYNVVRMAPNSDGSIPSPDLDATSAIQRAVNDAAAAGGGVVYLPAGWYAIATHLTVPANVELRGAASGPSRDDRNYSGGTVLFGFEGGGAPTAYPALITLNGANAGVSGLRIFYPGDNLFLGGPATAYPPSIRGNGSSLYVRNVDVINGTVAVDFFTYPCNQHYVENLYGWAAHAMVHAGNGTGTLRTIMSNGDFGNRNAFWIQGWVTDPETGTFNNTGQGNETIIFMEQPSGGSASNGEVITNVFAYGALFGVYNECPNTLVFNLGTDALGLQAGGSSGYNIVATQPITVVGTSKTSGLGPTYGYPPYGVITYYSYSYQGETGN